MGEKTDGSDGSEGQFCGVSPFASPSINVSYWRQLKLLMGVLFATVLQILDFRYHMGYPLGRPKRLFAVEVRI